MTETHTDISRRAYWLVSLAIAATYLLIWLSSFQNVYGWLMDDRMVYEKACKTVTDIFAPFRADDRNALHFYFYLISLLPAAIPVALPSFPLPVFEDQTGHFRLLLLYSVFLHAVLLLLWTAFAARISPSRAAALGSLVLFAASPSLFLWSPQPDSRYFGLLAGLPGAWLMLTGEPGSCRSRRRQFAAGLLSSIALSIHYTSAYLLGPLAACYWLGALLQKGRRRAALGDAAAFAVAFVLPILGIELFSRFVMGLPWEQGPAMFAVRSGAQHTSKFTLLQNLEVWLSSAMSQFGPLLLALIVAGWVIQAFHAFRKTIGPAQRTLALAIPLAIGLLLLSGKMPFFRMTTVLQPFLFLSASIAITTIVRKAVAARSLQYALAIALFTAVCGHAFREAAAVFRGHLGLGKALACAHAERGADGVEWLSVAWYGGTYGLFNPPDFRAAPTDSVLVTYFPAEFAWGRPASASILRDVPPVASFDTLWSTEAVQAEVSPYWPNNDWRADPLMNRACVYRLSDVVAAMDGAPLEIYSITADSQASTNDEPVNVFDDGGSPDGQTAWNSAPTATEHHLDIQFASRPRLGRLKIISPSMDSAAVTSKIDACEILADDGHGAWQSVWRGEQLALLPLIDATWNANAVARLRILITRQTVDAWTATPTAAIEEVVFPGYRPVTPKPQRTFAPLIVSDAKWGSNGVVATASGLGRHVVMQIDGREVPTRQTEYPDQLEGIDDFKQLELPGEIEIRLRDAFRESNSTLLPASIPRLLAVQPGEVKAGQPFNVQPDGTHALSFDCANVVRGTRVVFAGHSLKTAFGNDRWVTANLPPELVMHPGAFSIWLENPCGRSEPLEFRVLP